MSKSKNNWYVWDEEGPSLSNPLNELERSEQLLRQEYGTSIADTRPQGIQSGAAQRLQDQSSGEYYIHRYSFPVFNVLDDPFSAINAGNGDASGSSAPLYTTSYYRRPSMYSAVDWNAIYEEVLGIQKAPKKKNKRDIPWF